MKRGNVFGCCVDYTHDICSTVTFGRITISVVVVAVTKNYGPICTGGKVR